MSRNHVINLTSDKYVDIFSVVHIYYGSLADHAKAAH